LLKIIGPFSKDATAKLTCRYEAQRNSGQVERIVSLFKIMFL